MYFYLSSDISSWLVKNFAGRHISVSLDNAKCRLQYRSVTWMCELRRRLFRWSAWTGRASMSASILGQAPPGGGWMAHAGLGTRTFFLPTFGETTKVPYLSILSLPCPRCNVARSSLPTCHTCWSIWCCDLLVRSPAVPGPGPVCRGQLPSTNMMLADIILEQFATAAICLRRKYVDGWLVLSICIDFLADGSQHADRYFVCCVYTCYMQCTVLGPVDSFCSTICKSAP